MTEQKPHTFQVILTTIAGIICILCMLIIMIYSGAINLDPNVLADRTFIPSSHALLGIVAVLPGNGTYCIHAETLSRGEPVSVGLHYIIQVPTTPDRFGSTRSEQRGAVFMADNDHIVNETVVVPEGATDAIITASYRNYIDTNKVHVKVEKC